MPETEASPAPKAALLSQKFAGALAAVAKLPARPNGLPDEPAEPPLTLRAAALLVAHLIVEQGVSKAAKMTPKEVSAWAVAFRARHMVPWASVLREDPMGFQFHLEQMQVLHDTVGGYQGAITELLTTPKP